MNSIAFTNLNLHMWCFASKAPQLSSTNFLKLISKLICIASIKHDICRYLFTNRKYQTNAVTALTKNRWKLQIADYYLVDFVASFLIVK